MVHHTAGSFCDGESDQCPLYSSSPASQDSLELIEIYTFIDPTCPECWALEPILKKLEVEYGPYFTMRCLIRENTDDHQISAGMAEGKDDDVQKWEQTAIRYGMPCDGDVWYTHPVSSSYKADLAIKAAELQGKRAGLRYLRKLREAFFLNKENITDVSTLLACACHSGLDVDEFSRDMQAESAKRAFQRDMKIASEMEVEQLPALVFLNADDEEEGIKISGYYPYEAYEQVLCEMLGRQPQTSEPPDIEDFLRKYPFVATKEIAEVYNLTCAQVDREMKKLLLRQQVERIPVKNGTFWRSMVSH